MNYQAKQRTEAIIKVALKHLLNTAEYSHEERVIIEMQLKVEHQVWLDPSAICGEIEDLIEILGSRDCGLLAA